MVTLDFNNVDLQTFIKFISELTGKNFVIDEKVQGKVTVISPTKISVDDAYDVFLTVLDLKGFAAIIEGKVIKVVPSREAKQSGSSVVTEEKPRLPEENFVTRVIHLKYVSSSDLTKLLSPLLTKDGNMIPYSTTNLLILSDGSSNIEKLLELIQELDVEPPKGKGGINVYYLQNAAAEDMAKVLANLVSRVPQAPQAPGGVPQVAVARFEGGVSITADKATNSLIIMAAPEDYERIRSIIELLDIKRKQVYVEAAIMEMSMDKTRELGIEFRSTQAFGPGLNTVGGGTLLDTGGISTFAANPLNVTGLAVGVVRGTVTLGGATFLNVGAMLRALQQDSDVNVLSTPNILTMDNQEAKIIVGENVPFITGTSQTTGGNVQVTIERKDVGITLKLTPHTTESDMVRLDLFQEISSVSREVQVGPDQKTPVTTKRSAETTVMVRDRETVVIGGLITDDILTTERKVPFLGDIPLLGYLFKYQKKQKVKRNLLLFLTPYILLDPDTLKSLSDNRMGQVEKFRRKYHFEEKRDYLLNPPPPVEEPVRK
jgi:general secretion pathway protein D